MKHVSLDKTFLDRPVNHGFSGGEKKRNEILQMLLLDPELCILDETDSGLDVDSFKITVSAIDEFKKRNSNKTFVIVTHYKKLLDMIQPDFAHVMHKGRIIHTGKTEVAHTLEKEGFKPFLTQYKRKLEQK